MKKLILLLSIPSILLYAQQDVHDDLPTKTHSLPQKKVMVTVVRDTVYKIIHDTIKVVVYKKIKPKPMLFTGKWIITNHGKEIPSGSKESNVIDPVFDYNKLPNTPIQFESGLYSSLHDIKIVLQLVKVKN